MNDTAPPSVRPRMSGMLPIMACLRSNQACGVGWFQDIFFVAGVGGSVQIIASAADLIGDRALAPIVRNSRYIVLGAMVLGGPLLILDLHAPQRWYNVLRLFRKTSPMSIGTWVLISFGTLSPALAAAQFASDYGHFPGRAMQTAIKLLEVPAVLAGMAMSTYTGALLSATSTPLWAAALRRIAALFGALRQWRRARR
jgi:protein NrfD